MAVHTHPYTVRVDWSGGRNGTGEFAIPASGLTVPLAVPVELQGPGGATNPEELLTAAIASCYSIMFGIIAENRKLPVTQFHAEVTGEVEQNGVALKFTRIVIRPQIRIAADATDEQLTQTQDFAHRADSYCIITNAVRGNVEVVVEPDVQRG